MSDPAETTTRLTITLAWVEALQNPELFDAAEWVFTVWANGLERWHGRRVIHVGRGETVPGDGAFALELAPGSDTVEIVVEGTERDRLNPDDHAEGRLTLYRSMGFGRESGFTVDLAGPSAKLRVHFVVHREDLAA